MPTAIFADGRRPTVLRTQDERRLVLRQAANHLAHRCITPAGAWLLDCPPQVTREWLWISGSLLTSDAADIALANAAILGAPKSTPSTGLDYEPTGAWCISTNSWGVRIASQTVERPAWQTTGHPAERLPFLAGPAEPALRDLPHADFAVHGAPHAFWAIHSRSATTCLLGKNSLLRRMC